MKFLITDYDFPDVDLELELFRDAGMEAAAAQCRQTLELNARMIDAILTNTLLPELSRQVLNRKLEGAGLMRVTVTDGWVGRPLADTRAYVEELRASVGEKGVMLLTARIEKSSKPIAALLIVSSSLPSWPLG